MPRGDLARDESAAMTPGSRIPGDRELQALIAGAVAPGAGLAPLPGFKLDLSANRNFRKVFFKAGCDCGTAALLSVEVGGDKTLDEIEAALAVPGAENREPGRGVFQDAMRRPQAAQDGPGGAD